MILYIRTKEENSYLTHENVRKDIVISYIKYNGYSDKNCYYCNTQSNRHIFRYGFRNNEATYICNNDICENLAIMSFL